MDVKILSNFNMNASGPVTYIADTVTDTSVKSINDYIAIFRRRKGLMLGITALLSLLSLAIALGIPPTYRSSATILIEQQEIPQELVRSLITSFADERIQVISKRVMSTSNLVGIIEKYNLYPELREKAVMEEVLAKMREDIKLEIISADVRDPRSGEAKEATIAFTLSYDNRYPALAQNVANELVSLYLNENLKTRTAAANEASVFLEEEAKKLAQNIATLEQKLADFKKQNAGKLPELKEMTLSLISRTEDELREAERQARALEERRIFLEAELAQVKQFDEDKEIPIYNKAGERVLGPEERLKMLQTEYLALTARYAPSHPDVLRMRREIEALKLEVGGVDNGGQKEVRDKLKKLHADLVAARKRYSEEHPDVKRLQREISGLEASLQDLPAIKTTLSKLTRGERKMNPAYAQLKGQLNAANGEVAALHARIADLKAKYTSYETRLTQTPEVEREYQALTRDYDNNVIKHKEVTAKLMEAQLARSLETEHKGEKFTLVEPPLLPEKPAKPNRTAIGALGLVFAMVGGLGSAVVGEGIDSSIRGSKGVIAIMGRPPLAVVPIIEGVAEIRHRGWRRIIILGLIVIGVLFTLLMMHILIAPLDVMWFSLLRKLGI